MSLFSVFELYGMSKYSTTDINIAAILATVGFEFQGLDVQDRSSKRFLFEPEDHRISETIDSYYCGKLRLDPLKLLSQLRNFKNMIHQQR